MYKSIENHKLQDLEQETLKFWEEHKTFQKSVDERPKDNPFVFFEGPPTANGRPGIHHVISRTVKDAVCRLKTMQGYRVERKAGWDTHGLPVEIEVEKKLGLDGKDQVIEYGIDKFNKQCRESVWTYLQDWDQLTKRMGYWVDLDNPYITYENNYIESVWWILKEFWKKEMIYQGFKILPYCPHCETPLSGHEVSLGYKEVKDPSIYVKAKIKDQENTSFLVWTTTPWTLISNVALALGLEIEYVKVHHNDEYLILARERLAALEGDYEIVQEYKGSELTGIDYEPFFSFIQPEKKSHYTLNADFVTTSDGSGIVHIAPAFGEDDYQLGMREDLPIIHPVDKSGQFVDEITTFAGKFVKDADVDIIVDLKHRGIMYRTEKILHSYPHCWRCDTPLLYYARKSWYIRTTAIKEKLLENNAKIDWYPKEVGAGRFGEWLKNNIDWSLSRDRFWGTPLNIWRCESCDHQECIGSVEELRQKAKDAPQDIELHKPMVDQVDLACEKCGDVMKRVPEVIDCWFDSGSMPVAQWHYPFENQDKFKEQFPADFISEGVDQTRGWFYSLLVIGTFLFDQPTYKTSVSLEMILDKEGQKMSKSRGNAVDPFEYMASLGADTLRWYLLTVSPPWLPTRFDPDGAVEVNRKYFGTLKNTYSFFTMYANIDNFEYKLEERIPVADRSEIDRWINSALRTATETVLENYKKYDLTKVTRAISEFVNDDLSNWYVRRSRRRFWKSEMGPDKMAAFQTLYECLVTISQLMAPLAPFFSEEIYRNLAAERDGNPDSVHLSTLPEPGAGFIDFQDAVLEERMNLVRRIVESGRSIRNDHGLRVRQPLSSIVVVAKDNRRKELLQGMENLILEELNVKKLEFVESEDALMSYKAEPVFKQLGPKFGKLVNQAADAIRSFGDVEIDRILKKGGERLVIDNHEAVITSDDIQIKSESKQGLAATSEGDLTVALVTKLTPDLINEGLAREFVNRVQNMRKDAGYQVTDRIRISVVAPNRMREAIENRTDYISNETLAVDIAFESTDGEFTKDWQINGESVSIGINRV